MNPIPVSGFAFYFIFIDNIIKFRLLVLRETDSGGPLVLHNRLIGILSWGNKVNNGFPDGFTRVSAYIEWIQSTMAKIK